MKRLGHVSTRQKAACSATKTRKRDVPIPLGLQRFLSWCSWRINYGVPSALRNSNRSLQLLVVAGILLLGGGGELGAHDPSAAPITWNREISRIVYERCVSCHRESGTAFSLMTYQDAQPHASAMKDAVLSRRMPPWGAVKGFGSFQNDQGLTQEQIALVSDWVEGGIVKGNNSKALPPVPKFDPPAPFRMPGDAITAAEGLTLERPITLAGLYPQHVPKAVSMQVVATLPNGGIEPLVWLYEYQDVYRQWDPLESTCRHASLSIL